MKLTDTGLALNEYKADLKAFCMQLEETQDCTILLGTCISGPKSLNLAGIHKNYNWELGVNAHSAIWMSSSQVKSVSAAEAQVQSLHSCAKGAALSASQNAQHRNPCS